MTNLQDEKDRIDFIIERDGPEAAKKFAEQTLALYIKAATDASIYKSSIQFLQGYLERK